MFTIKDSELVDAKIPQDLREIKLPEGVTIIGKFSFARYLKDCCQNMGRPLVLPHSLTDIGSDAFVNTHGPIKYVFCSEELVEQVYEVGNIYRMQPTIDRARKLVEEADKALATDCQTLGGDGYYYPYYQC